MVVDDGVRVEADGVVDRRQKVGRMHRVLEGGRGGGVGLAVNVAPADAGPGDQGRKTVGPNGYWRSSQLIQRDCPVPIVDG
jgi:hypothetical protein